MILFKSTYITFNFIYAFNFYLIVGIKPKSLPLLAPCFSKWAKGTQLVVTFKCTYCFHPKQLALHLSYAFYQFMHSLGIEDSLVSLAKAKNGPCVVNVFILKQYRMLFKLSRSKRICNLSKLGFIEALCDVSLVTMIGFGVTLQITLS